ncbi:C4-dicarboxylate ABC transporter permease [Cryobacterium roopkundense]|uniref:C4-dicarboxylate ABC transporter permease n=1 Tax=Cryobacterium roopkundense TaxID=1001240 RepID=A0A099JP36_9MICO|nr:TRAP transporter large permease [Cryobacterium roopkundense]KGJ79407.1 C4-dicarboxylate ABC transporter permease [Cryobacterium roopkundense]MBB5639873.1 C4-dicarboxylate transporter DctM subunit [Cryobacterium roopkundense]
MIEGLLALLIILFALLLTSAPIAVAMGLTSFIYFYFFTAIPLTQVPERLFNALNAFPLMAIPFFIVAANLMSRGGISKRLIAASNALVGQFRGGLAMTAVLACMFFAAISGSSPATVVAVGTLIIPAMIKSGYGKDFSTGLVTTSGSLGILIPPSIPLIVYGISTEQSIGDLFVAGIGPGIMAGIGLLILAVVVSRRKKYGMGLNAIRMSKYERFTALRDASLSLFLPIFVLGGIYTGIFTPTEAAAMAVFYALIVSIFVYKEIKLKDMPSILMASARTSSMVMFIVASGILFSFVLTAERIPGQVSEALLASELTPVMFLIMVNVLLLVVGMFMETSSAILILAPVLLPVAMELGVDPIHFGIIMVLNLEIGMMTPPLGLNLFVASGLTGMNILRVAKACLPSVGVLLIALVIVTFVPQLSTFAL